MCPNVSRVGYSVLRSFDSSRKRRHTTPSRVQLINLLHHTYVYVKQNSIEDKTRQDKKKLPLFIYDEYD